MATSLTLNNVLNQYFQNRQNVLYPEQAKQEKSETMSAFYLLLEDWGFERSNPGGRMTSDDIERAEAFLSSAKVAWLINAREAMNRVFEKHGKSLHSQRTYGARMEQFLDWARSQSWWPEGQRLRLEDQCCPSRPVSGIRHTN